MKKPHSNKKKTSNRLDSKTLKIFQKKEKKTNTNPTRMKSA